MHKYAVRITQGAIEDIEQIASFYSEFVDDESAAKFSAAVIETLEKLDTFPERNTYLDEAHGLRRVLVKGYKVSVVYVVDDGVYEVVAFGAFHTSSEPSKYVAKLLDRLKEISS